MKEGLVPKPAERTRAKVKINISGGAGSGKTYSALLIAYGLIGKWDKIVVIDAENAANLYAHVPDEYGHTGQRFLVLPLDVDNCMPDQYVKAIDICIAAGAEVIIIDGISQEWKALLNYIDLNGKGTAWNVATPMHDKFIHKIISSDVHIITTCRRITENIVVPNEKGKMVPVKVGLKDVQRDGYAHEVNISGYLDEKHMLTIEKDRTQVFMKKEGDVSPFVPTIDTGRKIKKWCDDGKDYEAEMKSALDAMSKCDDAVELSVLCERYDFLVAEPQFVDALRLRAIFCLDNYKDGNEILQNFEALPAFKSEPELLKAYKVRVIELVHSFGTEEALRSFWVTICGTKEAKTSMEYLRQDSEFVAAVNAAKELISKKPLADPFQDAPKPTVKKDMTGEGTKERPLKKVFKKADKSGTKS